MQRHVIQKSSSQLGHCDSPQLRVMNGFLPQEAHIRENRSNRTPRGAKTETARNNDERLHQLNEIYIAKRSRSDFVQRSFLTQVQQLTATDEFLVSTDGCETPSPLQ